MVDSVIDRRKFQRHQVVGGSLFVCKHGSENLLTVKNISAGGLQFVYFPDTCENHECQQIDIMQHSSVYFCVAGVCCQIIYDIPSLSEDLSFSGIRTRLAGVKFTGLTAEHRKKLFSLIDTL